MVWFAWLDDPYSSASHAGQVSGDNPEKKRHPGPPGWALSIGLTTTLSHKERLSVEKPKMNEAGLTTQRRTNARKRTNDLRISIWNVLSL